MPRSYRLGKRKDGVSASRERVIDATRRLLGLRGYHQVSVETVADAAGVSRATVYNQFRSKQGILEAVLDDIGRRIQFDRVLAALADADPRRAAWRLVVESATGWTRDRKVIGRILGLVAADPELATLVEKHELGRRRPIRLLVNRLHRFSGLRPGVGKADAYAMLGAVTGFATYNLLREMGLRGLALNRALARFAGAVVDFDGGVAAESQQGTHGRR